MLSDFADYLFSIYQNSLLQLTLFLAVLALFFLARHIHLSRRIHNARRGHALVIGGWGTRGKSGTERLKAALINALGFNVVSKTTGCEAMFLHAHAFGDLREMVLFRPYDKATIWEQANLLQVSQRLQADVFLWECMGLTPAYVRILQNQWMQDDVATITNAYPDHEDLQGPAGINIPQVMNQFIPPTAQLLTTEEHMLPILKDGARAKGTAVKALGWREAGLLPPDILARFPYEEHPYNIALVQTLAADFDIPGDVALKEMADRVVEDIGVLKVFPTTTVADRQLTFVNGMSANERFGAMSNWRRTGFASHDPEAHPDEWLCTLINNRADRVPRSQVFAEMLATELAADRHFLIGTNLAGLQGYIQAAWERQLATWHLWPADAASAAPAGVLEQAARWLRLPRSEAQLARHIAALLTRLDCQAEIDPHRLLAEPGQLTVLGSESLEPATCSALEQYIQAEKQVLADYQSLVARLQQTNGPDASLERAFHAFLRAGFARKFIVIWDHQASGEAIIQQLLRTVPPGLHARVMGMQNIKGTGLDFVYRWQAWDTVYRLCEQLQSEVPETASNAARALASFTEFGNLSAQHVRWTLAQVKASPIAQNEFFQAELAVIESNLVTRLRLVGAAAEEQPRRQWLAVLLDAIEAFIDAGEARKRRKRADRIYRDLSHQRISYDRASYELRQLNNRQQGGWLYRQVAPRFWRET